ncbi:hypothetical protein NSE01_25660 [Novosphingobium sediminis]|uniref:DUF2336 domain-containing protein n=1 Tax=Novosphingobium sediminis TaxID=707214 RepID=A0A512AM36_9SPHN|nr:hypothetical protein [Novosphingobium sediminis]GEO00734.1 hypothetical protein NSE01_25660 [Novosphingobium sediminis]
MAIPATSGAPANTFHSPLAEEIAAARGAVANVVPILRQLLRSDDNSIFSDEIIARVRGMFVDVARQLVIALAEAAGHAEPEGWAHEAAEELAHALAENPAFLEHFHTLALEWQWTVRLERSRALDPVLPPLLQARMADPDALASAGAMNLLAAQARFCQSQRRMQLPLAELPGDLLHIALMTLRAHVGTEAAADTYALIAERSVRAGIDETRSRLAQMGRVLDGMGGKALSALEIDKAGLALFLTALARGAGLSRESAIMATVDSQLPRLLLALRACGLAPNAVADAALAFHPDAILPQGYADLSPADAAALLGEVGA